MDIRKGTEKRKFRRRIQLLWQDTNRYISYGYVKYIGVFPYNYGYENVDSLNYYTNPDWYEKIYDAQNVSGKKNTLSDRYKYTIRR